jgi:hypothetical protein
VPFRSVGGARRSDLSAADDTDRRNQQVLTFSPTAVLVTDVVADPAQKERAVTPSEDANKALVIEAFNILLNVRDYAAAQRLWSSNLIEHSAHAEPGRAGLFDFVRASPPDLCYEHQLVGTRG